MPTKQNYNNSQYRSVSRLLFLLLLISAQQQCTKTALALSAWPTNDNKLIHKHMYRVCMCVCVCPLNGNATPASPSGSLHKSKAKQSRKEKSRKEQKIPENLYQSSKGRRHFQMLTHTHALVVSKRNRIRANDQNKLWSHTQRTRGQIPCKMKLYTKNLRNIKLVPAKI